MEGDTLLQCTRTVLGRAGNALVAAWVFGSVARANERADSDLDVALLYREAPPPGLAGLGFDIAHALELVVRRPVDVVVLNSAPPDLSHRVLRDGLLALDNDRPARIAFEVHTRSQYFDLAPLRRRMRASPSGNAA